MMIAPLLALVFGGGALALESNILAGAPVNDIVVSAGNVTQCGIANVTWTNAVPPVNLQIGTGGYYVGTNWLSLYNVSASSTNWTVTQPANTSLIFQVTDAKGTVAYQQNVLVGPSADSTCLVNSTVAGNTTVA